jgi:TonB-linked SusC/RagA family outer membrane protein
MGLLVLVTSVAWSQTKTVTGKVTAVDDGSALPGVNILEKGTSNGTVTSVDGTYAITVKDGATLVFSFVGYQSKEIAVGTQSSITVSLTTDVTALSEVVVIGYGQVEKKDATGAIASLKPEDFNGGVITSPEQLIQGRTAGVQITSASGEPGAGINIRIRGTSSVRGGNNPLFVVDGVPLSGDDVTSGGSASGLGSSAARNPLNFINPNDIASIDILKDASATAIYGSRGANGVIIITTKSGRGAKSTLDYAYSVSVGKITKKYDLLEREQYLDAYEAFNTPAATALLDQGANTDWQDQILRTAITHNHNISFGGGDDKGGDYRFSLGMLDQEGIIRITALKRYTARFNGSKKFLDNKLRIGTQMTVAVTEDSGAPVTDNSGFEGDLLGSALKANPTMPVRGADGKFVQPGNTEPNPAAILAYSRDYTNALRVLGNVSGEYEIVKGLSFKTVLGVDRAMSARRTAFSKDLVVSGITDRGRLYIGDIEVDNRLWENYFTYTKKLSNININAVLGYSYQRFSKATKGMQLTNFRTNNLDLMINNYASALQKPELIITRYTQEDIDAGKDPALLGEIKSASIDAKTTSVVASNSSNVIDELQSYFGRVEIGINDKYLFTGTLRADGSTKFGSGNQYGYFPSLGFKWRTIEEDFVPSAFSDLNLRASYGITGNQEIPHNLYQQRQRYEDWDINFSANIEGGGLADVAFPNEDLKWETTSQFNVGVDFGFLSNRIRGTIDYYNKNTSDLLIQVVSAQPAGRPFVWKNLDANVINSGLEISLEGDVVSNNDFKWTVISNVSFNKNEIKNYGGLINTGQIHGQGLSGAFAQRIANGQTLFAWYVREFGGYDEDGNAIYIGGDVQKFMGTPLPKANAGLTNNLRYKAFDLSIFFSGQFGHKIYNNTANAFFTAGSLSNGRNVTKDIVGNGEGKLNAPDVSTRFLEDASFVRLQNVTLGYNFKTQNTFVSALRVFLTGQNLFVITDYSGQDPEVNTNKAIDDVPSFGIDYTSYPRARTFTFGVSASF